VPAWLAFSFHSPGVLSARFCMTSALTFLQPNEKLIGALRRTIPPGGGRRRMEGAQDVVRVFIAVLDDLTFEDDRFGLLDFERCALDV